MLTTLWLLLSLSVPVLGLYPFVSCPKGHKCKLALLSNNDILLECPFPKAYWYYHFSLSKEGWLINPSGVSNMEITSGGDLAISSPLPSQTGLYHCWEEKSSQVTQFEIDFQDVHSLHITHKNLGKMPLQNESLTVGSTEFIFSRWEPWQDCDRCGVPGERKRLGYCYIEEPGQKPMPCGLYMGVEKLAHGRLRPELQVEACFVPCHPAKETDQPLFFYESSPLGKLTDKVKLTCPFASIYRPVSWEANNVSLTWQNELSGKNYNSILNLVSGGQQLQIFQPAIYRCFVEQELVAQFNPMATLELLAPGKRENKTQPLPRKADLVPPKLKLVLLMGTALALGLLLFNTLCSAPGKSRKQMLLAK